MATIASCPRCAQQVTIPGGAAASDTVRCPLCGSEYQLEEALAKAPPTLVVVSTLAVVTPEPAVDNESELHLFPAAESPYDFVDTGSGSNELPVDEIGGSTLLAHDAPVDPHEAPLMAEVHGLEVGDRPADDFHTGEAEVLELPANDMGETPAHAGEHSFADLLLGDSAETHHLETAHDSEEGDFLASFDDSEPPAGESTEAVPVSGGHHPGDEPPHTLDFGAAEPDWLGEPSAEGEQLDLESTDAPPHAFGDSLAEKGEDEISFGEEEGEEESFKIEDGERGFETVNLDSGFEERRPIPEDVEGYGLDAGSTEVEVSEEELNLITEKPSREARRKPSALIGIFMYMLGLFVFLPLTYLGLMWGAGMDPLHLASMMPSMIVPAALNTNKQMARGVSANELTGRPAGNDPIRNAMNSQEGAPPDGTPMGGAAPGDDNPLAGGAKSTDDDENLLGDPPASNPADLDTGDMDPADAAAIDSVEATHDPDAAPGDAEMADTEPGDADAAPADADEDDMPAATAPSKKAAKVADDDDAPAKELADTDADSDADPDAMPAEEDAATDKNLADREPADSNLADSDPAEMADKAAEPEETDADDMDAAPAKKPAAKVAADDSPAGAALDAAMLEDDASDAGEVGPRDSAQYSPADVDQALSEVASASRAMDEAPAADIKKTKGQFYRKLYHLAEVATFTPSMAASADAEEGSQQDLVGHTLVDSAASPAKFAEVGKAAAKWLDAVKGKEHQGIVLSGTLQSTSQRGKVYESLVLLTDGQHVVTVLSPAAPTAGKLSSVLVWGSVADDPAQSIAGYDGEAKTAVWTTAVEQAPPEAGSKPAPGTAK